MYDDQIVSTSLKIITRKLSQSFRYRVAKSTDLLEWDYPEIPGGMGVGYGILDFGTTIGNISGTEQDKDTVLSAYIVSCGLSFGTKIDDLE